MTHLHHHAEHHARTRRMPEGRHVVIASSIAIALIFAVVWAVGAHAPPVDAAARTTVRAMEK